MREMSDQLDGGSMLARADGSEVGMISTGVAETKSRILGIARTSTTSNLPRVRGLLSFLRKAPTRRTGRSCPHSPKGVTLPREPTHRRQTCCQIGRVPDRKLNALISAGTGTYDSVST